MEVDNKAALALRLFLLEVDERLGGNKSDDLLTRIAKSGNEFAWQADLALKARTLYKELLE